MSALHASNYLTLQSNLALKNPSEDAPLPDVILPSKLADLIARLSSENGFPEPWTTYHSMHSEVGAMANWIYQLEKDAGEDEWELPRESGGRISTSWIDTDTGEKMKVSACGNCKALLDWFGIRDLTLEEEDEEESGAEVDGARVEEVDASADRS